MHILSLSGHRHAWRVTLEISRIKVGRGSLDTEGKQERLAFTPLWEM
jgi:hypothetical protein